MLHCGLASVSIISVSHTRDVRGVKGERIRRESTHHKACRPHDLPGAAVKSLYRSPVFVSTITVRHIRDVRGVQGYRTIASHTHREARGTDYLPGTAIKTLYCKPIAVSTILIRQLARTQGINCGSEDKIGVTAEKPAVPTTSQVLPLKRRTEIAAFST